MVKVVLNHKCPRCNGTLVIEATDAVCIMCSFTVPLKPAPRVPVPV